MFQAGVGVQGDAAAAAEAGTLQQRAQVMKSPESATVRTDRGLIAEFSDSQVGKILVRLEPGGIRGQALCASRVIQRNHLVHYGVQRAPRYRRHQHERPASQPQPAGLIDRGFAAQ
jgi:hypothetical protein